MSKLSKLEVLIEDRRRMLESSARYLEAMGVALYRSHLAKLEAQIRHEQTVQG